MPKQLSDTIITGNIDGLIFYKMEGKGYVRRKSSLTGKQFKTQKRFLNSRKSAERLSTANKLASKIYKALPEEKRDYTLFCQLKTKAIQLLKQVQDIELVKANLETFSSHLQHQLQQHAVNTLQA